MARGLAAVLFLLPILFVPPAEAQTEFLYDFELSGPTDTTNELPHLRSSIIELVFRDRSHDSAGGYVDGGTPVDVPLQGHQVNWDIEFLSDDPSGWLVAKPLPMTTFAGQERIVNLPVTPSATVADPYAKVKVTAVIQAGGETFNRSIILVFWTPGVPSFQMVPKGGLQIGPRELTTATVQISNLASLPQTVYFSVTDNPCKLRVGAPAALTMPTKGTYLRTFSIQGPEEKFWYNSESCSVRLEAYAAESPDIVRATSISVDINGFYVAPEWVFWLVAIALIVLLVFLFIARRIRREQERIFGKPQKPWTIPVERVYLEHLRRKDERAWYVVRHHLMEEEYRSALLWYREDRKAMRGTHAKERFILREERKYTKWRERWERRLEVPLLGADAYESRLAAKLERQQARKHKKAMRVWKKDVARIKNAHADKLNRATNKWQAKADKATKKGRPVPPKPTLDAPTLPPPPEAPSVALEDHAWAKRAARRRRRAERERGDLEVRYEAADERMASRVIRRMKRKAAKLDDPDFVSEHPMLSRD
jgi:hypothetical protein